MYICFSVNHQFSVIDANFADLDSDGNQDLLLLSDRKPLLFLNDVKLDIFIAVFRGSDVLLLQH